MVEAARKPIEVFTTMPAEVGITGVSQTSDESEGPGRPTAVVLRTSIGVADPQTGEVAPLAFVFKNPKQIDWLVDALARGRRDVRGPA